MSGQEQGTGKHGHKDTQEPWPHHGEGGSQGRSGSQDGGRESRAREGGSQGGNDSRSHEQRSEGGGQGGSGSQGGGGQDSLQAREYRDKDGNVHHHTRTYMEQHDKGGGQ